jgi:hypothetical protein
MKPLSDKYLNGKLGIRPSRIIPVGESMGEAVPVEWCTRDDFKVFAMVSPSI